MRLATTAFYLLFLACPIESFLPQKGSMWGLQQNLALLRKLGIQDASTTAKEPRRDRMDSKKLTNEKKAKSSGSGGKTETATKDQRANKVTDSRAEDVQKLQEKLKRLRQTRPYPLFLAEKGVEISERMIGGVVKSITKEKRSPKSGKKEKVVVLGTGWGAASFVKDIDTDLYDVTVISPRNYFLFTPMLAGSSVGSVEYRSITEPFRELNHKVDYLEATATSIDPLTKVVTCESVIGDETTVDKQAFKVNYDKLIITIGAQTNTFGIPGVAEHCHFLKQIDDARKIRAAIVNCFERANIPTLTEQERVSILTFAVIGAGPAGFEFAAELRDFIEQDGPKYYPTLLKYVRIKVIEATSTVLAPFVKELQDEAMAQINREFQIYDKAVEELLPPKFELVELLLDSSVKEVTEKIIYLNGGKKIGFGVAVWAAGNGPLPLTLEVIKKLGEEQAQYQNIARGRIATDPWLRALGSQGSIISLGDCSCIIDGPSGPLPTTAQVAAQQAKYLAYIMNKEYNIAPTESLEGQQLPPTRNPQVGRALSEMIPSLVTSSAKFAKPFQFMNLGMLAYTGSNTALAQIPPAPNAPPIKESGKIGNALWKGVYLIKQVSFRNQILVLNDWIKRQFFGRDITQL